MKPFIRGPMLTLILCCCLRLGWSQDASSVPPASSGSTSSGGSISIGAKTGVNFNQFSQPGTSVGANVGAYASYDLLPFLTVKLEPQYSQEGGARPNYFRSYSDISDNISGISFINPQVTFHNLQIPLLLELTLPEFRSESVMPKLILGGSYSAMMLANETHTKRYLFVDNLPALAPGGTNAMDVSYERENVTDNYLRNQWSLIAGFGLQFKAAKRDFSFDVRYRQGMNDLNQFRFSAPSIITGTGGQLFSSSISFNLSVSIFKF